MIKSTPSLIMSKSRSPPNRSAREACTCVALTALIVLELLLVPCHAEVFHLPLKQYRKVVSMSASTYHRDSNGDVHVFMRRAASSPDKVKLDSMKDNLHGLAGDGYYVDVNIGNPPQTLQVLIDTGSANFAIGCEPDDNLNIYFQRDNSSTYEEDGAKIDVAYTEGSWTGTLGIDMVALTSASLLSTKANIACITSSQKFYQQGSDWQGILGFAYSDIAQPDSSITPFWDSMMESHPDLDNVFSIQLCGSSFIHTKQDPSMTGSLILGGYLPSMAKSEFFFTPVYKTWYYEVIITDIQVGEQSLKMDCKEFNMDKTIVDSGTTNIRLPVKVFEALTNSIDEAFLKWDDMESPGNLFYSGVDTLCFDDMARPFSVFPVISFSLMETENTSFKLDLTPQHYLRPVVTETSEEGEVTESCVKFGFTSSTTGTVLGAVLMEAFYVVFDRSKARVGFAQSSCPLPDPSHRILNQTVQGPYTSNTNLNECAFQKPDSGDDNFLTTSYVLLAISLVICVPLLLLCVFRLRKSCQPQCQRHSNHDSSETQQVFSTIDGY